MTRSFTTKGFARFAKREGLSDSVLCRAVEAMERGLVDADLGSGVDTRELAGFRLLAKHVLAMSAEDVDRAVEAGAFQEVRCDDEEHEALRQ